MCTIKNIIKFAFCLVLFPTTINAKATFLPDLTDSETGFSSITNNNNYNTGDNCNNYPLSSCPTKASCSSGTCQYK